MNPLVQEAQKWVGYWNKQTNSQLESFTANKKYGYNGYTIFGQWYGLNPAPWCGIFISYCGNAAGCLDAVGGKIAYVPYYTQTFQKRGRLHNRWEYTPQPGDIVIFGDEEHVGIVESCSSGYVTTIEGNANGGCVARNRYSTSSEYITYYCETRIGGKEPAIDIKLGTYKNGSTPEPVYSISSLSKSAKIGELNKYETCRKLGTVGSRTIVLYRVDGTQDYKVGFVEYGGS